MTSYQKLKKKVQDLERENLGLQMDNHRLVQDIAVFVSEDITRKIYLKHQWIQRLNDRTE